MDHALILEDLPDNPAVAGNDALGVSDLGSVPLPEARPRAAWVALVAGLGAAIGARLGNVQFWIVIGAVAGLVVGSPGTTREPGAVGEGSAA